MQEQIEPIVKVMNLINGALDPAAPSTLGPFEFQRTNPSKDELERFNCDEIWYSGRYQVYIRKNVLTGWSMQCECVDRSEDEANPKIDAFCETCKGSGMSSMPVTHLSIKREDRESIHDWRDLQIIKSLFCGQEAEGIEIYPAESRMVDTANQYHLWVFPQGAMIPVGFNDGRLVAESKYGQAKQRPFEVTPEGMVSDEDFRRKALAYCESKGMIGEQQDSVLGNPATDAEIRAVYAALPEDELKSAIEHWANRMDEDDPDERGARWAVGHVEVKRRLFLIADINAERLLKKHEENP